MKVSELNDGFGLEVIRYLFGSTLVAICSVGDRDKDSIFIM